MYFSFTLEMSSLQNYEADREAVHQLSASQEVFSKVPPCKSVIYIENATLPSGKTLLSRAYFQFSEHLGEICVLQLI